MANTLLTALLIGQAAPPPRPAPMAPPPIGPPPGVTLQPPMAPPPGVIVPPPPGQVPPPAGLPGEIPPDENAPKPRINIEGSYPKVTMLKYVGIGFLMAAAVMAMVMNHFLVNAGTAGEPLLNLVLGLGLLGVAILFGLIAFFNEDWRRWMSYFSTFAMVGGIAARPIVTPLVTYDFGTVLPAVIFAFTFFMYLEYLDAYQRFTDVARMAVERNLQSFNINQVINHFLTWGAMLAAGFMVSALVILTIVTQLFAGAMGEEIARSVEMQAVFGQALAITVIFTLVAVVLSFLFLFLDRRTEVEQVAYSREQIRDMVQKGGQPGAAGGPQGPAAPTTIFPPGKTAGFVQQK